MKLRIHQNSIRLRLSQGDLAALLDTGAIEEHVAFPAGPALSYRLESGARRSAEAEFTANRLVVRFPASQIDIWAGPDEVGMYAEQPLEGGGSLELRVEKDFRCLSPREGEDDADLFPNPGT